MSLDGALSLARRNGELDSLAAGREFRKGVGYGRNYYWRWNQIKGSV